MLEVGHGGHSTALLMAGHPLTAALPAGRKPVLTVLGQSRLLATLGSRLLAVGTGDGCDHGSGDGLAPAAAPPPATVLASVDELEAGTKQKVVLFDGFGELELRLREQAVL